ncbi:MAG: flagellar protein FlaG [Pseudomonadota bacterium]
MEAITMTLTRRVESPATAARPETQPQNPAPAGPSLAEAAPPATQVETADLAAAAAELADRLNLQVELGQDGRTGRNVVRIFSHDGERLLRQIPPETTLKMLDRLRAGDDQGLLGLTV